MVVAVDIELVAMQTSSRPVFTHQQGKVEDQWEGAALQYAAFPGQALANMTHKPRGPRDTLG